MRDDRRPKDTTALSSEGSRLSAPGTTDQKQMAYTTNPDIIETDLGEELVLLDPRTQEMYTLNATGRAVWQAMPAGDAEAIATIVTAAFAIDHAQATLDVRALLNQLSGAGLLRTIA
jgi:hypothetical protein